MRDEEFFQQLLDQDQSSASIRWLFAQWLAQQNDWRAAGYAWMAECAKYPEVRESAFGKTWDWWSMLPMYGGTLGDHNHSHERLAPALFRRLEGFCYRSDWSDQNAYCEFRSRREAEEALCRAILGYNRTSEKDA